MTGAEWLVATLTAALDRNAALAPLRVFAFEPDRATLPFALIEAPSLRRQDGAGVTGRVGTVAVTLADGGEQGERLRFLMARVEEVAGALPDLPAASGWRLAALSLAESRTQRAKSGWRGRLTWSARLFRTN